MYQGKTFVAVVPARGGSKAIPHKNIVDLGGKPLLAWTLATASKVPYLDRTIVSSDHQEILSVADRFGATPLRRPAALAEDAIPTAPVLLHVADVLAAEGKEPDYLVTLEPTSPFRRPETVIRAIERAIAEGADTVVSGVEDRGYFWVPGEGGTFRQLDPSAPRRRQDRTPYYREGGTVYVTRTAFLRETGSMASGKMIFLPVAEEEGIDINTPLDLVYARAWLAAHPEGSSARS